MTFGKPFLKLNLLFCVLFFSALPSNSFGQTPPPFIDQVVDFEDLNLSGFVNGGAPGPFVTADATGNNALEITTNGAPGGGGSGVLVFNNTLTGDLSSASTVNFDVNNPNLTPLNIRFSISDPTDTNVFVSNDIVVPAATTDSLSFLLDQSQFVQASSGLDSFAQTLANVDQFRILSNPNVAIGGGAQLAIGSPILDLNGDPVAGSVFVDNFVFRSEFATSAVPEPGSASLLLGLAGALVVRRRRNS